MFISRVAREIRSICSADGIILDYAGLKALDGRVNLHYYHAELQEECADPLERNLGDCLSEVVVRYMCERNRIQYDQAVEGKKHLYAIGSILLMGYQDACIWGSGMPFAPSFLRGLPHRPPLRKLDIRCVRGPGTRKTLMELGHDCPEVYGDPAVLMPLIYRPKLPKTRHYVVIPHYSRERKARELLGESENIVSMNTTDYRSVIDRICSAEKVVTSSLHGIILAESYGVPACLYQDMEDRFLYKYFDWYASTGSEPVVYKSIEEAAKARPVAPPREKICALQESVIRSFPGDIWGGVSNPDSNFDRCPRDA